MRQRPSWLQVGILASCLTFAGAYITLALAIPPWVRWQAHRLAGDRLAIGRIRLGFPLRVFLDDVRLSTSHPGVDVSARRVVAGPIWYAWSRQTLWVRALEFQGVRVQIRHTAQGTLLWPTVPARGSASSETSATPPPASPPAGGPAHLFVQTVGISNGTVELLDEKLATPFRGSLGELSVVGGPLEIPSPASRISVAGEARVVGAGEHASPVYCSGWISVHDGDLEMSCQLEPLPLAAFTPYYERWPVRLRELDATVQAHIHLAAKSGFLNGRIQLEIGGLSATDLSGLGRKLADAKYLAEDQRRLTGEIKFSGPLDRPDIWQMQLTPGNELVQRLINPLVDRGIGEIQIKLGQQTIAVELEPGSDAASSTIEEAAKDVEENLELLAPGSPSPEPSAAPLEAASVEELPVFGPQLPSSATPSPSPSPSDSAGQPPVAEPAEIR